ncbi:MAG: D-alanyl-D-alanine carboxypeptidase [Candidatus Latescibacterota bacterium]|nr:MAG: D-alanyl-D-alanine carboxypeptidase [Candidatus Latescibacterota bacterium]
MRNQLLLGFMKTHRWLCSSIILPLLIVAVTPAAALDVMSNHPYLGAIAVDAVTGDALFEDNPDAVGYPASVVKLMVLLIILEAVEAGHLTLDEPVTVTRTAAKMGGSQVYLEENEVFPVDELLYALVVRSANDAAAALAIHYAGSKEAFIELMNGRARDIDMNHTVFHSVHGLPPGRGQLPDISTARDIAELCRVLVQKPIVFKYTSTRRRLFRTDADVPFEMVNHNPLLKTVDGCDGLKTGFFYAAGFSIAATAAKEGKRVIAVVIGAESQRVRDARAKKILTEGLSTLVTSEPGPTPASTRSSTPTNKVP